MVDELVKAPDPILRQASKPIGKITPKVKELAEEMVNFMDDHSKDATKPIGLSACQLGHSVRMIAFWSNPQSLGREDIVILINPEFVYTKGHHTVNESCLSLPGKFYLIKRYKLVKIRGLMPNGTSRSFRGRDLLGQVFQHELNHLDGVLIDSIGELVVR